MMSFHQKTRKKDVGIVTFDLIGLLATNHVNSLYFNGIPELKRKCSMLIK